MFLQTSHHFITNQCRVKICNMSASLKKHWIYLQLLLESNSPKQRKALLNTITLDQVKALSEIAHNLIRGIIPISTQALNQLRKHRTLIRLLGDRKKSYINKKQAIKKRPSGILSLLKVVSSSIRSWMG